jgi:hypothetical protein
MISYVRLCMILTSSQEMDGINSVPEGADMPLINHPAWFWLFLIQCLIILVLTHLLVQKKINTGLAEFEREKVNGFGKTKVDMANVVNSINEAEKLYKELSRKCHPDRFIGDPRHGLAEALFQEISANRRNHAALQKVKQQAHKKLFINQKT